MINLQQQDRLPGVTPGSPNVVRWMDFLAAKHAPVYRHSVRVAILADMLAQLNGLNPRDKSRLVVGCFLHDLGKAVIPEHILTANRSLTEEEWRIIRMHPLLGVELVAEDQGLDPGILEVMRHHHERVDGSGYPDGLAGEEIPLFARICAVLDAFDAMMSERPYRKRMTAQEAKQELITHSGSQFDKSIVEQFLTLSDPLLDLYSQV